MIAAWLLGCTAGAMLMWRGGEVRARRLAAERDYYRQSYACLGRAYDRLWAKYETAIETDAAQVERLLKSL